MPDGAASTPGLSNAAQRVQAALTAHGLALNVIELPQSTRTAVEAAQAVGCEVGQIAKSLIFRGAQSGRPVLVITAGSNRVDERAVAEHLGEPLAKADADFVRARTGFAIGGVPPVGHAEPLRTLIDEDLLERDVVWAAAGTPNALFRLTPAELVRLTGGAVIRVK
jgi:prolyl-tRNA editing enzyme YbaK/EbsC (Cys-tRNA(Pro) deacylase)